MKQKAAASFYLVRFPDPLATGSRGTSLPFTESGSSRSQLLAFTQRVIPAADCHDMIKVINTLLHGISHHHHWNC